MMKELAAIRELLQTQTEGDGAIGRVARVTLDLLKTRAPAALEETVHS